MNTLAFIAAALLVAIAALLIAAETALSRVSASSIETAKKEGVTKAGLLLEMLDERARYVNTLKLTHLSLSTLSVIFVTAGFDSISSSTSQALALTALVMIVVGYIFLGVAPQTLGKQRAESIALATAGLTRLLSVFLGPFAWGMIALGNAITPGKGYREGPFTTQAELRELVDLAGADSLIEDDERQMIHSVFELGDTIAREVMVPRTEMVWIESTKTLRQAMSLALRSGYSRIPVVGDSVDDIIGVIYLKDIAKRIFEHADSQTAERVESLMRPTYLVPDTKSVDELLKDMQSARTHIAILVDEYGGTAGMVTIEDVLEEIVGEISDEYDNAAPEIEELANGSYRVSSRLHVEDFAELIGWDYEDEGVDTLSGLMAKRLGIVPIPGAQISIGDWVITAQSTAGRRNRVDSVLVERDSFSDIEEDSDDAI